MHNRYGWVRDEAGEYLQITAPYAQGIHDSDNSVDAIRVRGAGAYVNDVRGTRHTVNASLDGTYLHALCDIEAGDEIFADYGTDYWTCAAVATHSTSEETARGDGGPPKRRKFCS